MVLKKDATEQKTSFDALLDKWGRFSASEADKVLDERETAKPEADLPQATYPQPEKTDYAKQKRQGIDQVLRTMNRNTEISMAFTEFNSLNEIYKAITVV
ncbi:hypothetical protein [Candidatus Electrothrix sp.]|uniref:hypothetical protein n=1 Tax=Candidatus Electrothrix sp. TaxID=2170559 RepID=UPI004055CF96